MSETNTTRMSERPHPKRYIVHSDRIDMHEDPEGNWVAWSDYVALRAAACSEPVAFMVLLHVRRPGTANVPYRFYYGNRETAELEADRKAETIPDASFAEIVPLFADRRKEGASE